jgi:hypothetical protein
MPYQKTLSETMLLRNSTKKTLKVMLALTKIFLQGNGQKMSISAPLKD